MICSLCAAHKSGLKSDDKNYVVNCGTFLSTCFKNHKVKTTLYGFTDSLPTDVTVFHEYHTTEDCSDAIQIWFTFASYVKDKLYGNNTHIYGDIVYKHVKMTVLNKSVMSSWTCTTPIELNKEYDIMDTNCVDSTGVDPLGKYKNVTGYVETISFEFTKDYLIHSNIKFFKQSNDGCAYTPNYDAAKIIILVVGVLAVIGAIFLIFVYVRKENKQKKTKGDKNELLSS